MPKHIANPGLNAGDGAVHSAGYSLRSADFYRGKTLTIIQGRSPGGIGDIRTRTLIPFLQKHIPGNPNVVIEYLPGGDSRKAANHLFTSAKPDGLTLGNFGGGMVASAVLGYNGLQYDLDKLILFGASAIFSGR